MSKRKRGRVFSVRPEIGWSALGVILFRRSTPIWPTSRCAKSCRGCAFPPAYPHRIQTYVTASFWLRTTLNQPDEAEQFLREGLRANPDSFEILIELGYILDGNRKNPRVARNVFDAALQKWKKQVAAGLDPTPKAQIEILDGLVRTDEELNDLKQLLTDLEALKLVSPNPAGIEKTIQETRAKLATQPPARPD